MTDLTLAIIVILGECVYCSTSFPWAVVSLVNIFYSFKTKGNLTKHMKSKAHTKNYTASGGSSSSTQHSNQSSESDTEDSGMDSSGRYLVEFFVCNILEICVSGC